MNKKEKYAFKKLLAQREFRAYIWRLLNVCQTFRHGFIPNDAQATAFTEGQRSIGCMILDEVLGAAPQAFLLMREEYFEDLREQQKKEAQTN